MNKVLYLLVAVLVVYFFGELFGFSWTEHIMGVISGIALILTFRLYLQEKHYDGQMIVANKEAGGKLFSLELNGDPEELEGKDSISFKVVQSSE